MRMAEDLTHHAIETDQTSNLTLWQVTR